MDKYDPHRRIVLRGTLATGVTLLLGTRTTLAETAPVAKLSKAIARYQTEPSGEQRCAGCAHFVAPNACRVVEGDISPDGWCTLWLAAPG